MLTNGSGKVKESVKRGWENVREKGKQRVKFEASKIKASELKGTTE